MQTTPTVPAKAPATSQGVSKKSKTSPVQSLGPTEPVAVTPQQNVDKTPKSENAEQSIRVRELPSVSVSRDWTDRFTIFLTIILVIVGGLGVRAAYNTLKIMERQTKATEDAAKAALESSRATARSLDFIVGKERPRISVEPDAPKFDPDLINVVPYKIDCWCPTPAFIVVAEVEAYTYSPGIIPKIPFYIPIYPPNPIRESIPLERHAIIFEKIDAETLDQIKVGRLLLYFHGRFEYRGVHLSDTDPSYRSPFSYKWIPQTSAIPGIDGGYWEECGEPEDNRDT